MLADNFLVSFLFLAFIYSLHWCSGTGNVCIQKGRDPATNCIECLPGLDPTTNCTRCLESETECKVGNFTFSALFHSYVNPLLMCGECRGDRPICCDEGRRRDNCDRPCNLMLVFSFQPYGSTAADVMLIEHDPIPSDNITFNEGPEVFHLSRSNPFTAELKIWTGQIQFYIVTYDAYGGNMQQLAVLDRFPIDLRLGIGPNFTERTTYHGIHNLAQFNLSFRIQCSENYYGSQCDRFCSETEGQFMCDDKGNVVCVNSNHNPETSCLTCLPGWDPNSDCRRCLPGRSLSSGCTQCLLGWDAKSDCVQCLPGRDLSSNCTKCLPGRDRSSDCVQCLPGRDLSSNCTQCLPGRDRSSDCVQCLPGRDLSSDCTQCLPGRDPTNNCNPKEATQQTDPGPQGVVPTTDAIVPLGALIGGVLGGILVLASIFFFAVLLAFLLLRKIQGERKQSNKDSAHCHAPKKAAPQDNEAANKQDFTNPIYYSFSGTSTSKGLKTISPSFTLKESSPESKADYEHEFHNTIYGDDIIYNVYSTSTKSLPSSQPAATRYPKVITAEFSELNHVVRESCEYATPYHHHQDPLTHDV